MNSSDKDIVEGPYLLLLSAAHLEPRVRLFPATVRHARFPCNFDSTPRWMNSGTWQRVCWTPYSATQRAGESLVYIFYILLYILLRLITTICYLGLCYAPTYCIIVLCCTIPVHYTYYTTLHILSTLSYIRTYYTIYIYIYIYIFIILYYIHTILYHNILCYITLYYIILYRVILVYSFLFYSILFYFVWRPWLSLNRVFMALLERFGAGTRISRFTVRATSSNR